MTVFTDMQTKNRQTFLRSAGLPYYPSCRYVIYSYLINSFAIRGQ